MDDIIRKFKSLKMNEQFLVAGVGLMILSFGFDSVCGISLFYLPANVCLGIGCFLSIKKLNQKYKWW